MQMEWTILSCGIQGFSPLACYGGLAFHSSIEKIDSEGPIDGYAKRLVRVLCFLDGLWE